MAAQSTFYDVAIVGAGPAGAAAAIHLARAGCQVALLDRSRFPRDKPCAEYLSPGAEPLLAQLGVLDAIERTAPAHLKGFRIYAPGGRAFQGDFAGTRGPDGAVLHSYGLTVPRLRLDAALVQAARVAGATLLEGMRVTQVERAGAAPASTWQVQSADQVAPLRARVLIAADGVHSTVARRLSLHRAGRLRKIALVAHLRGIADLSEYGEVHVARRRYVGLAPLEPQRIGDLCNVALVVDEDRDGHLLAGRVEPFLMEALATFPRLAGRLGNVVVARRTLTTSRVCVRATRVAHDALLLIGDAAGYYDPFTGEGIFQALKSAQLAAEVGIDALSACDVSAAALAPYAQRFRAVFRGKRPVESLIQSAVQVPPMMDGVAHALSRRKWMADTIVAVTGDYVSPSAVLNPGYLVRLLI